MTRFVSKADAAAKDGTHNKLQAKALRRVILLNSQPEQNREDTQAITSNIALPDTIQFDAIPHPKTQREQKEKKKPFQE